MAIRNIDPDKCTGCGICEDLCPNDVIRMNEQGDLACIKYGSDCSVCFICEEECPGGAIEVDGLYTGIVAFLY